MALGVSSAVAANSPPAATAGQFETTGVEARHQPVVGDKPTVQAVRTELRDAIKPTPTTAPAVTVDFGSDRILKKEDMNQYPITGPDKFAKNIELQNQHAIQSKLAEIDQTRNVEEIKQAQEIAKGVSNSGEKKELTPEVNPATKAAIETEPVKPVEKPQEMTRVEDARTKDRILAQ